MMYRLVPATFTLILIAIVIAAADCPPDDPVPPDVVLDNFRFAPETLTVALGDSVRWRHDQGLIPHTVTSGPVNAPDGIFDSRAGDPSARMRDGDVFAHAFSVPGVFDYHCVVHGGIGMTGVIRVLP